ncbi:MAG: tetratricopeptide repeat protein [Bacteroidia bacterium]
MRISMILLGLISMACLWDKDTIEMEFEQFPGTLELISGHFLRHSPEFYYWRIKDREQKLQSTDSLQWHDDLAVAYSKLGNDPQAIAITQAVLKRFPERYESLANLGTFYIHNGQYQEGLAFLKEAVRINPDAHFGREKYQIYLVDYLISIDWPNQKMLPLDVEFGKNLGMGTPHYIADFAQYDSVYKDMIERSPSRFNNGGLSYYDYVLSQYRKTVDEEARKLPEDELKKASQGVSGMIKFGNHDSPILLEVLGELLAYNNDMLSAHRHLAIIAYLRAGYLSENLEIQALYQQKVMALKRGVSPDEQKDIQFYQNLLDREVKAAEDLSANIRKDEMDWILAGKDPEKEFAAKYYRSPQSGNTDWSYALRKENKNPDWLKESEKTENKEINRQSWNPQKLNTKSLDSTLKAFVDSEIHNIEMPITNLDQPKLKPKPDSNSIWYALLIGLAILGGGFYAFKNRT